MTAEPSKAVAELLQTAQRAFFIDGSWRPVEGTGETIEIVDPATEQPFAAVGAGGAADVDAAVAAARRALPGWAGTAPGERAAVLARAADGIERHAGELASLITREMGSPIRFSTAVQVGNPIRVLRSFAEILAAYEFEETIGNSLVLREPAGVIAAITPWNFPLHQVVAKVAAALGAGCPVVLKPSEVAPLSAYWLADILRDAGLPAGAYNVVSGTGPVVGEMLADHPDIDMVSFTGSTAAGKRVMSLASGTVKRVALELGGKSACVILDGADLASAVKIGIANCFINAGQTCTAWTRMLVPERVEARVRELVVASLERYSVGDPFGERTRIGPLANAAQYGRVTGYVDRAVADGATLIAGGSARPDGLDRGYFVAPTVFADVAPDAPLAREEVFGPVLALMSYTDEDHAVEIANSTPYGLSGAVFAADDEAALCVARRLRTGIVDINGGAFNPIGPFGGYKQSGLGRELGRYGLEEFLEVKSLQR